MAKASPPYSSRWFWLVVATGVVAGLPMRGAPLVRDEKVVPTDLPGTEGVVEYEALGLYDSAHPDGVIPPFIGSRTMVMGPDNVLWYIRRQDDRRHYHSGLGRIRLDGVRTAGMGFIYTQYPTEGAGLFNLARGGDNDDDSIWYTCREASRIGRIYNIKSGSWQQQEWRLPGPFGMPEGITAGPDGAMWFTYHAGGPGASGGLGRITADGKVTNFPPPEDYSRPKAIVSDGASLWFIDDYSVYRMDTSGHITTILHNQAEKADLTFFGDSVWFTTKFSLNFKEVGIGRIVLNAGSITKIVYYSNVYNPFRKYDFPNGVTGLIFEQSDKLWYSYGTAIGLLDLKEAEARPVAARRMEDGHLLEFRQVTIDDDVRHTAPSRVQSGDTYRYPFTSGLLQAPSGETMNIWFLEQNADRIARFPIGPYDGPIGFDLRLKRPGTVPDHRNGEPFVDLLLGTLTDTKSRPSSYYTATVNWGDGTVERATLKARTSGEAGYEIVGSHAYDWTGCKPAAEDRCSVSVALTVSAQDGRSVPEERLGLSGPERTRLVSEKVHDDFGDGLSNAVVATFVDRTGSGSASDFAATIDWRDGTTSQGVIVPNGPGSFKILGTHTFEVFSGELEVILTHGSGRQTVRSSVTVPALTVNGKVVSVETPPFAHRAAFATISDAIHRRRGGSGSANYTCESVDGTVGCDASGSLEISGDDLIGTIHFFPQSPEGVGAGDVRLNITLALADGRSASTELTVRVGWIIKE